MPDYGVGASPTNEIYLAGGNLEYCTTITGEISAGSFISVGYTDKDQGGVFTDKQPSFKDTFVTGIDDPVKRRAKDREVTLKCLFRQVTLENFAIATGGLPSDVASNTFKGGKSVDAQYVKWRYTVQNPDDATKDIKIVLMKAKVQDASEVKFSDSEEAGLAVTLKAYAVLSTDTAANGGTALTDYRYVITRGSF
jgi:hypothetical protein